MIQNTKLLVIFTSSIIFIGLGFVWYGLKLPENAALVISPSPTSSATAAPVTTQSSPSEEPAVIGIEGERALVTKVVDGDTIQIEGERTVRFIGIDTPETVDPRRPVGCFGKEASNKAKEILTGKTVILQKDVSDTDKYKRLLRYIYLPLDNGGYLFVNDYLVREGYALVLTYPPDVKFNERLREAEREAKENNRGLWGAC